MGDFYAVITNFPDGGLPDDLAERSKRVQQALVQEVPSLTGRWVTEWALDDSDVHAIDVVSADDRADVEKAAEIISREGQCQARVAQARTWDHATGEHLSA
jgi:hypothetical protein